jgi:hypothetical protein
MIFVEKIVAGIDITQNIVCSPKAKLTELR